MHLALSHSPSDCMAPWWEFEKHDEQKAATCSILPGHALDTHSTIQYQLRYLPSSRLVHPATSIACNPVISEQLAYYDM